MSAVLSAPLRHQVAKTPTLMLTSNEAWALVAVCQVVQNLDPAVLAMLAGDAHPVEAAELPAAFQQLGTCLALNGWK